MKKTAICALIAVPVLLTGLSGCTPPAGPATVTATGLAACVEGHTWTLDAQDVAAQLLSHFQATGLPVTSATGSGSQTLDWGVGGSIDIETDNLTYELVITENATKTLSVQQVHNGPATGTFTLDGTTATPSDWDASGYVVTTSSFVNGEPGPNVPIDLPDNELTGVKFDVTCSGTTLTTLANDGFITYKWTR